MCCFKRQSELVRVFPCSRLPLTTEENCNPLISSLRGLLGYRYKGQNNKMRKGKLEKKSPTPWGDPGGGQARFGCKL